MKKSFLAIVNVSMPTYFAIKRLFQLGILAFIFHSCIPYKIPTETFITHCSSVEEKDALQHWLYRVIPRHRCQIRWFDLPHWASWMLLGNDDDGIFGEGPKAHYLEDQPADFRKAMRWALRNPLHNFCFYTIGTAWCRNSEITLLKVTKRGVCSMHYCENGHIVFADPGSSFFLGLHGWKPFVSLRLAWSPYRTADFYLGWRPRGNFGVKILPAAKRKPVKLTD